MKAKISYKGTLAADQIDALKSHLRTFERDPPLVFKGREDIIGRVSELVADLKRSSPNTIKSLTLVIQGAPGAGKTSLINELKNRFSEKELGVTTLSVTGKDLKSKNEFVSAMLSGEEEITKLTVKTTEKATTGVNLLGVKGDLASEKEYASQIESMDLRTIWRMLEEVLGRDKVILLCVDEAQTVKDSSLKDANPILVDFHTGETGRLRIIPIFAGLNDTEKVLGDLGMSRLSQGLVHHLSSLSKREAEGVVLDTLNHESLGLADCFTSEDKQLMATSLAIASDRWPRHLHCYIQGVIREVANDQERDQPHNQIDFNRALDYGHEERIGYYKQRVNRMAMDFNRALIRGLSENPDELSHMELKSLCCGEFNFTNIGYEEELEKAIHVGLIEPEEVDDYVVKMPIPSFKTYMVCGGNPERTKSALRQQLEREFELEINR